MSKIDLFQGFEINLNFSVSFSQYKSFQDCSKDMNPLHTDESFATSKGFRGVVMYGNMLNAFISYAIGMRLPTPDVMIQTQDIQFKKPVYLNDDLVLSIKTDEIHEGVHVVILSFIFTNQDVKVVAKGHIQIGVFE